MMEEMPKFFNKIVFTYIDTDESEIVDTLNLDSVQTVLLLHPTTSGKKEEKIVGIRPE